MTNTEVRARNVLAAVAHGEVVKARVDGGSAWNNEDFRNVHGATLRSLAGRGLIEWTPGEDRELLYARLTDAGRAVLDAS